MHDRSLLKKRENHPSLTSQNFKNLLYNYTKQVHHDKVPWVNCAILGGFVPIHHPSRDMEFPPEGPRAVQIGPPYRPDRGLMNGSQTIVMQLGLSLSFVFWEAPPLPLNLTQIGRAHV